ncbi:hypothetical protein DH2020_027825 [Rehmannia glutinosa]|uniref:DNA polymerase epsilon catalytic subunit n=1 Tax=Rehmannia glutinosa TaxID=99300 RepID=A0ABR0VVZ1_REHGL
MDLETVSNYDQVKNAIREKVHNLLYAKPAFLFYALREGEIRGVCLVSSFVFNFIDLVKLRDEPIREDFPLIYHLDVAAIDYYHIKRQIESEIVDSMNRKQSNFLDLPKADQQLKLKERLKKYCQKAYKRVLDKPITELREAGSACVKIRFMLTLSAAKASGNSIKIQEAQVSISQPNVTLSQVIEMKVTLMILLLQDMVVLYDSLQLAHKCILNSFYGYVMRKGARWYSMEMAGVVTYTGAKIIQNARLLVERIGRPLELDTDGIWCALPGSFPENFTFKTRNNTNDQYQTLKDPFSKTYTTHSECSIEFEVDGPYKAMIIPASKEEGILIKKRYAVFNDDGTLAELKGFEIKRRGELKLIKVFQAELFDKFLHGSTLEECYSAVASVANRWLDLLDVQSGEDIADSELLGYISESSTMSKSLADYGEQKSCAVTTAKRLADFLGDAMVKDKDRLSCFLHRLSLFQGFNCFWTLRSLTCYFEQETPVSERAVPVAIFETEAEIMKFYVKKWCKVSSDVGIRSIIDWSYYKQRLSSAIQKIITIPAAMQKVEMLFTAANRIFVFPIFVSEVDCLSGCESCPEVVHPDWLHKKVREKEDKFRQRKLVDIFSRQQRDDAERVCGDPHANDHATDEHNVTDMEDFRNTRNTHQVKPQPIVRSYGINNEQHQVKTSNTVESSEQNDRDEIGDKHSAQPLQEVFEESIDRNVDYRGWLELRKRKWKETREQRKRQRVVNQYEVTVTSVGIDNYAGYVILSEEFPGRRVNKILPHGHQSYNLIEVTIDEDQFRSESKKLAAHLADPEVEGIYESKIPLEFSAILQIGCVCKVDNISDSRAMYVAYFPASSQIYVVVVSPFQSKELSPQMLERQFREASQALSFQLPMPNEGVTFKVDYVGYVKDAQGNLQRMITEYRHRHHGPVIAVIECPNIQLLKSGIRALEEFPCVTIPCNARDSQYQALGWQVIAAKIGIQRCAASSQWLNERVTLSRYAHVPMGNFEVDWLILTADIFLSRALRDHQQVLWISDNGIPDLGGTNEEVPCFIDEVNQPVLTYPGAYRKVTVELKIHHLAVNALLKSNQLNEMEGGALFGLDQEMNPASYNSEKQYCFDEETSCAPAFRVLKQLIQRCLADAVTSGNVFADAILQNLYRWLCSPKSKLHDPALHRMLHKVMQKVFALLMAELRKLGTYLSGLNLSLSSFGIPYSLWISSLFDVGYGICGKHLLSFISEALQETSASGLPYSWIFSIFGVYDALLIPLRCAAGGLVVSVGVAVLSDIHYNYGGIQARLEDRSTEECSKASVESMHDDYQVDIVSSWTIAENLTKATQFAQEEAAKRASVMGDLCTPSITASTAEILESQITDFLKKKIGSDFTDKLLKIVCDPSLHIKGRNKSQSDHNTSTGSLSSLNNIHKGDSALDFIKYVCAVLALDQKVQHEVLVMRRNLLKLVRIREFAPEAEFQNLFMSLTLPNVICSYCNDCRDLDLCRDRALIGQQWRCGVAQCGQPYDGEVMENALLQIARQRERLYHLQDLVCLKCYQIKAAHLAEHCSCAGSFVCKEVSSEFRSKMQILLNVAVDQKFQLLQECVSWILEVR